MLKKEVKRLERGLPQEQADQRTETKYLLGITDEIDDGWGKGVKVEEPKEEPKEEEKEEEEEVVEVKSTRKK